MDIVEADSSKLLPELAELQPEFLNHMETDSSVPLIPLIDLVLAVVAMECRVMRNTFDLTQASRIHRWILKEFQNDWPEANMVSAYFGQVEQAMDQEGGLQFCEHLSSKVIAAQADLPRLSTGF
jgi:hypothetical protein